LWSKNPTSSTQIIVSPSVVAKAAQPTGNVLEESAVELIISFIVWYPLIFMLAKSSDTNSDLTSSFKLPIHLESILEVAIVAPLLSSSAVRALV